MLAIKNEQTDPFFNLATDEYLLYHKQQRAFRLWITKPAVIIGKFQNAFAEINYEILKQNNVSLIRRMSGGGAVYIDQGTLNYTFILNKKDTEALHFKKVLAPIINYLNQKGIPADFTGKNNITVSGKKISGNAQQLVKDKLLHHGTLLIDTDIDLLKAVLLTKMNYTGKAVKSIRSEVMNISDLLNENLPYIKNFRDGLYDRLKDYYGGCNDYVLDQKDMAAIDKLVEEKYALWEWNYGNSPDFTLDKQMEDIFFHLVIRKGRINDVIIEGNFSNKHFPSVVYKALINKPFREQVISIGLRVIDDVLQKEGLSADRIIHSMFY